MIWIILCHCSLSDMRVGEWLGEIWSAEARLSFAVWRGSTRVGAEHLRRLRGWADPRPIQVLPGRTCWHPQGCLGCNVWMIRRQRFHVGRFVEVAKVVTHRVTTAIKNERNRDVLSAHIIDEKETPVSPQHNALNHLIQKANF